MSFLCSPRSVGWRRVKVPISRGSEIAHWARWLWVSPPIVQGYKECFPQIDWVDAKEYNESISIQKLHNNKMSHYCPGQHQAITSRCLWWHNSPPIVGVTQSVTTCCPGQWGVSRIPVSRAMRNLICWHIEWAGKFGIFKKIKGTDYEHVLFTTQYWPNINWNPISFFT